MGGHESFCEVIKLQELNFQKVFDTILTAEIVFHEIFYKTKTMLRFVDENK
jgi:hypothetical protein